MTTPDTVPVLEVGGTHVSSALVDPGAWTVSATTRLDLDPAAPAEQLLARFAAAALAVTRAPGAGAAGAEWGVAMPDPFDYRTGVGRFHDVGKFEALDGVDVGAALRRDIDPQPTGVHFVNDADAFVLGEWTAGAARGTERCVGITLGTGIGSGWLAGGEIADPGVPEGGRVHRLRLDGRPLEDLVSRRAIRRAFAAAGGDESADVRDIAGAARAGDGRAGAVLREAFRALGRALAPPVRDFGADVVVVGGSMAGSWDLVEPLLVAGASGVGLPPLRHAARPEVSPLVGAAVRALRASGASGQRGW